MAIHLAAQQQAQQEAARAALSPLAAHGCGKAAAAADLIRAADDVAPPGHGRRGFKGWQGLGEDDGKGFGRAGQGLGGTGELKDVPFEMLVLEVLLDATTGVLQTQYFVC